MFLGVRIFIFLQKRQKIKTEQQTFQTFVDVFCAFIYQFLYTFCLYPFTNKHLVIAFFLILRSNKIEQNPTCLHCIENTELVG